MSDVKEKAAIVLVISDLGERKVLAVTNRRHGGWGFPGGKWDVEQDAPRGRLSDPGDPMKVTAARELREETGLEAGDLVRLGRADWGGRDVSCYLALSASGEVEQREDGTVPRWRPFDLVVEGSPFAAFYREMFPDGVDHFVATRLDRT